MISAVNGTAGLSWYTFGSRPRSISSFCCTCCSSKCCNSSQTKANYTGYHTIAICAKIAVFVRPDIVSNNVATLSQSCCLLVPSFLLLFKLLLSFFDWSMLVVRRIFEYRFCFSAPSSEEVLLNYFIASCVLWGKCYRPCLLSVMTTGLRSLSSRFFLKWCF